jgi:hypothetical protein
MGAWGPTEGNVKRLLPPRQSRGISFVSLGIIFMLGGTVVAYVKALQSRIGKQEQAPTDCKLEATQHYVSKEYMNESERRILDSIRDLARRIDNVLHINRE